MIRAERPVSPARVAVCSQRTGGDCFERVRSGKWPSLLITCDALLRLQVVQTTLAHCVAGSIYLEAGAAAEVL